MNFSSIARGGSLVIIAALTSCASQPAPNDASQDTVDAATDVSMDGEASAADATAPDVDPQAPCATFPPDMIQGSHPADSVHRAATYRMLVRGTVTGSDTPQAADAVPAELPEIVLVQVAAAWARAGAQPYPPPSAGQSIRVAVDSASNLPVGYDGFFFVTAWSDGTGAYRYHEGRPEWRLAAMADPDLPTALDALQPYLAARPMYASTIAEAAAIADVTVTAVTDVRSVHCSSNEYSVFAHVERTLCGGPSGEIKVLVPAHSIAGCAGAADQGPQPMLSVGQRAILKLGRDWEGSPTGPTGWFVWAATDVHATSEWDTLQALRVAADR